MTEDINKHIEKNLKQLEKVTAYEKSERTKIKDNLKNFHSAVNECEAEIKSALNQQYKIAMDEQNVQAEKLKAAVLNNDTDGIENFLKQIKISN